MKLRILSAVILLPIFIGGIVIGGPVYAFVIAVAILLAALEYVQLLRRKGYTSSWSLVSSGTLIWLADALWGQGQWLAPALAVWTLSLATWELYRRTSNPTEKDPIAQWALTLAGGMYLGIGGAYLVQLRALPDGRWWTLTALPVLWVGESAAYFIGSRWGRHKMSPSVSPGKSWEGYGSELVSGLLIGAVGGGLWPLVAGQVLTLTVTRGMLLGGIIAALTPIGDFFISILKREVGAKDSGTLIPGHGGALDRIDSLLWTGTIAWLVITLLF